MSNRKRRKERERHRKWSSPNQYLSVKKKEANEKRISIGLANSKGMNYDKEDSTMDRKVVGNRRL
jgi:hypothetical protein